jgi:hypothetical protein
VLFPSIDFDFVLDLSNVFQLLLSPVRAATSLDFASLERLCPVVFMLPSLCVKCSLLKDFVFPVSLVVSAVVDRLSRVSFTVLRSRSGFLFATRSHLCLDFPSLNFLVCAPSFLVRLSISPPGNKSALVKNFVLPLC